MGIDYRVWIGPFAEFKYKTKPIWKKHEYRGCLNKGCDRFNKACDKFCGACGHKSGTCVKHEEIKDTIDWESLEDLREHYHDQELYLEEGESGSHHWCGPGKGFDPKRDFGFMVDLSEINVQQRIEEFKTKHAERLAALTEFYGVEPIIRFGCVSSCN